MLAGSPESVAARFNTAQSLLMQGRVDYVMVSVGKVWLWGKWFPQLVEDYIEGSYEPRIASRDILCEMNTDSTQEEALALRACLRERGWRSVLVVTSDYHTRRARRIWRKLYDAPYTISVYGVKDGELDTEGWWRSRHYAKTWLLETSKLVWSYLFGA